MAMIFQTVLPALAFVGLVVASVVWGEDSALPAGLTRDGRAVRWSLRPSGRR